jgi:hypothetical protein
MSLKTRRRTGWPKNTPVGAEKSIEGQEIRELRETSAASGTGLEQTPAAGEAVRTNAVSVPPESESNTAHTAEAIPDFQKPRLEVHNHEAQNGDESDHLKTERGRLVQKSMPLIPAQLRKSQFPSKQTVLKLGVEICRRKQTSLRWKGKPRVRQEMFGWNPRPNHMKRFTLLPKAPSHQAQKS